MSYLNGSYLGETEVMQQAVVASQEQQALLYQQAQPLTLAGDTVQFPGGIILPKKALLIIAATVAVAIMLYLKHRNKG